jgi:hypothetical protein
MVRFANLDDGWIVSPTTCATQGVAAATCSDLWATNDGGRNWTLTPDPGGSGAVIEDLEASDDTVQVVVQRLDASGFATYSTPASADVWTESSVPLGYGAGPVPAAQITLQGPAGWILDTDRVVIAGAELESGTWTKWAPPCPDSTGTAALAASSPTDVVALCQEGIWGTPDSASETNGPYPSYWLFQSSDGGNTFTPVDSVPTGWTPSSVAQPADVSTTVVVATNDGLYQSFDGGKSWSGGEFGESFSFVGFTTSTQGVAIGSGSMLMTHDGGKDWTQVTF